MNRKHIKIHFLMICFHMGSSLISQAQQPPLLNSGENKIICRLVQDESQQAEVALQIRREEAQDDSRYILTKNSYGNYERYTDIQWRSRSQLTERNGKLYVEESTTIFETRIGELIKKIEKRYDYATRRSEFIEYDNNGRVIRSRSFVIQGPICDDVTLNQFLRAWILSQENFDPLQPQRTKIPNIFLMTNEGKVYNVVVIYKGTENIMVHHRSIKAQKWQLMADLGPLTQAAASFVPPTYVWFEDNPAFQWIKYQGMESGYQSAYIEASRVFER
ncbi:MAG: hypothetical protein KC713_09640 [Candidatus Omnitrophica bacterium]|nr:hypothetical protein [Candidatus Omnitrophota bacterium]